MLTMALIGCLPDNVQQAIKSFSIRHGKQHITFAFPFMEETLRSFCGHHPEPKGNTLPENHVGKIPLEPTITHHSSVLFFDECLEVVHGFQTYVTILPQLNRPCARSSLPVVLLTLYQRDTTEGICRHFQCLIRTLVEYKGAPELWKLPIMVTDLSSKYKEMVLEICAETICEVQAENLTHTFPAKSPEQLTQLIKEKFLRPCILSYPEFLRRNTQEVMRSLTTTDPSYFISLIELLQSNTCSILDYKKVDMMFKSPAIDPVIRDMWRIWGHEQISRKVFPVGLGTPLSKLGPLYGPLSTETGPEAVVNMGTLSHVPVKEGLQSVIKCLKSQDISQIKVKGSDHDTKYHSCSCSVCKIQPQPRRNSRLRLYGDFAKQPLAHPSESSAFHFPFHKRQSPDDFCSRTLSSLRFQTDVSSFSYHHHRHHTFSSTDGSTRVPHPSMPNTDTVRSTFSSASSSSHIVQPVPQYLPLNLKAFSQRMLYGYQMINKSQYPLSIPSRSSH